MILVFLNKTYFTGVLPLGKSNTVGKSFFPGGEHLTTVRSLADASMAVIERFTRPIDVMKIEVIDDEESQGKAVYAVAAVEWGAYRDARAKKDKYWYFGPFRNYATYIFNGYTFTFCIFSFLRFLLFIFTDTKIV